MRLNPDAPVRDHSVRRRHLNRRHGDALPDRHVADRRARPLVRRQHEARRSRRGRRCRSSSRSRSGASSVEARRAELLRERDGADVRRLREDPRDAHRLGAAHLGVVDHAVGDVDRVRKHERRARRDDAIREHAGDRDELERRARLVHVGDGAVSRDGRRRRAEAGSRRTRERSPSRARRRCAGRARRPSRPSRATSRASAAAPPPRSPGSCGRSST